MAAKTETSIENLQKYRAALITAVVTGKIDVRGTVHPSAAAQTTPAVVRMKV
ncbi:MAG TPA: hypothetical protein VMU57_20340 [Edaphobacter sp.]|uniref:restriction endonuclease subunit S n=1 Tax=Edaphobacter sp. TaxID=1934404 RepID=UPI002BF6478B|nr:hypothetical protein [Edaphobacter sp.]HUZ97261.1 hypothetical protein [Edaphobacter sp.]